MKEHELTWILLFGDGAGILLVDCALVSRQPLSGIHLPHVPTNGLHVPASTVNTAEHYTIFTDNQSFL